MRQALAKGTRRELRRAVGVSVLDAIQDMEQVIAILQTGLSTAHREIASLAVNHAEFKQATARDIANSDTALRGVAVSAACAFAVTERRSFSGRLRWLFTGQ